MAPDWAATASATPISNPPEILLSSPATFPAAAAPTAAVLGDFTGTADTDLLTTSATGDDGELLPGNGDGTFGAPQTVALASGADPQWAVGADFNDDGLEDAAVLGGNGDLYILRQRLAPARGLAVVQTIAADPGRPPGSPSATSTATASPISSSGSRAGASRSSTATVTARSPSPAPLSSRSPAKSPASR